MTKRIVGLDIIRFLAIFFVISVHYYMANNFYNIELSSFSDFMLLFFRELFYTCVPLFLLLTGYLNGHQKFDKNYVYKIVKILISYILIGIICLLFRKYYLGEELSKTQLLVSVFNFTSAPYGWYVEMYVSLFFFIPFLNLAYNNIKNKSHKLSLLFILIFFTSMPSVINSFSIHDIKLDIIPDYWTAIYPVTYYYVGRYLHDYPLNISLIKKILLLIITLLVQSLGLYFHCYNQKFAWEFFGGYGGLFTLIASILIFSIFANKDIKYRIPRKIITTVSLVSFEMYLISYIFDQLVYPHMLPMNHWYDYIFNYLICVPTILIGSFIIAFIINKISNWSVKKIKPIYNTLCNKILKI